MQFKHVSATISDKPTDKELAKIIFNFFLYQRDEMIDEEISARQRYNGALAANEAAEREYRNDPDYGASGFGGYKKPYTEEDLKLMKDEMERAQKNKKEIVALFHFIRDRFVDKFISN